MPSHQNHKSVLIFRIGSLGDTLIALPAFHLIRAEFPNSQITLLTNSPADGGIKAAPSHQILIGSGLIDNYIEYPHGKTTINSFVKAINQIHQLKPDQCIYLMPIRSNLQRLRDAFFFFFAGIFTVRGLYPKKNCNTHPKLENSALFESEASRIIRTIGFSSKELNPSLFSLELQKAEYDSAKEILGVLNKPFISLSVGAKVPAKDWGADRWTELLQILQEKLQNTYSVVFLGSQDEHERCESIARIWSGEYLNLCGAINPRESAAVLNQASLFIGHDSGPMHLASSVGIPCISIFAARNKPGVWFPIGNEDNVFYNEVPCSNCRLSVCTEQKMVCIRSILATEVAERAQQLLSLNNN